MFTLADCRLLAGWLSHVNLVHRNLVQEAIEETEDKIDFGQDDTLLQVQLVPDSHSVVARRASFSGMGSNHSPHQP